MALTARAQAGLEYAAGIAKQTVAEFSESKLEDVGLSWAEQADAALTAKKLAAFDKADAKATKEQILTEAAKVEVAEMVK